MRSMLEVARGSCICMIHGWSLSGIEQFIRHFAIISSIFNKRHTPLNHSPAWHRYTLLLHAIGWTGYLAVVILLWTIGAVDGGIPSLLRFFLTVIIVLPGLFYTNILVLIPRFFQQRQWTSWFASHALLVGTIAGVDLLIASGLAGEPLTSTLWPALQTGLTWVVLITSIAFIYRYLVDGIAMPIRMERLEAERDAAELAFLKSQVDPHFLFNTLNNLYALALDEEAPQTAESIALLGRLMRYSLHDAQTEKISLKKEIEYLETYVSLQRLRVMPHARITFQVDISEEDLNSLAIAPLLLIPFVENAFKYGIHASKETFIDICFGVQNEILSMHCTNTIARSKESVDSGEVGYKNVRQRLQHLYPDAHTLDVDTTDGQYAVKLEVHL